MYNPFSLEGKTILVTGASSGIGRSIAVECSKMGAKVIITARNGDRLNQTLQAMEGDGHKTFIVDLCEENQIDEMVSVIENIDGLVNCAGCIKTLPAQFINKSVLVEILNINFVSPTILATKLVKNKKINRGGSIVFISSISGSYCSVPANAMYSSSKSAIDGVVKGLAVDFANKGIRVNSVNPGMVDTNIMSNSPVSATQLNDDVKRYPLKRYGHPEDIALATVFLLSNGSNWITGTGVVVDGGRTILY